MYLVPRLVAGKLQVLFLHEKGHEGRGALWPVLRGRVCVSLIIYQMIMAICLALKLAPAQAILTVLARTLTPRPSVTSIPSFYRALRDPVEMNLSTSGFVVVGCLVLNSAPTDARPSRWRRSRSRTSARWTADSTGFSGEPSHWMW